MFFEMDTRIHDKSGTEKGAVSVIEIEPGHWVVEAENEGQAAEKLQAVLDAISQEGFMTFGNADETYSAERFEELRDGAYSESNRLKEEKSRERLRQMCLQDEIREDRQQ